MVLTVLCKVLLILILFAPTAFITVHLHDQVRQQTEANDPLAVIRSYLKATYARDYRAAYSYISAADQRVHDEDRYVQGQGEFTGFTARLAGTLANLMAVKLREEISDGARKKINVEYSVPTAEDVSSLVWEWNAGKLNSLSTEEQTLLLDAVAARQRTGNLVGDFLRVDRMVLAVVDNYAHVLHRKARERPRVGCRPGGSARWPGG